MQLIHLNHPTRQFSLSRQRFLTTLGQALVGRLAPVAHALGRHLQEPRDLALSNAFKAHGDGLLAHRSGMSLRLRQWRIGLGAGDAEVTLATGTGQASFGLAVAAVAGRTFNSHNLKFTCSRLATPHLLAAGLKLIHSVKIDNCQFDQSLSTQLAAAHRNVINGWVDESDFDPARQGRKAADLFDELVQRKPENEDAIFTHGDYCLPNIILNKDLSNGSSLSGFIDWGSGGIGDSYRDLALAARSLSFNCGAQWVPLLFEAYGLVEPDQNRLDFYTLLDEFF